MYKDYNVIFRVGVFPIIYNEMLDLLEAKKIAESDLTYSRDELDRNPSSMFWRRTYLKNFFSFLDVWSNYAQKVYLYIVLKRFANNSGFEMLNGKPKYTIKIDESDLMALMNKEVRIESNGTTSIKNEIKAPFKSKMIFILRMMRIVLDEKLDRINHGPGYEAFLKATDLRKNAIHPNNPNELEINDELQDKIRIAVQWFIDNILPYQKRVDDLFSELNIESDYIQNELLKRLRMWRGLQN